VWMGPSSSNLTLVGNVPAQFVNDPPETYSFTPTGLQGGTTYFWQVVARTFATPVDGSPSGRLQRRWLAHRNAQGQVLRHNLLTLRSTHGIDVHVTFRALPFTPPVKLYLLNGTEALFAYYTVTRGEQTIDQEHLELYDAEGTRSLLFAFEEGAGPRDTTLVEQSRRWFDALWDTISSELVLTS